MTTTNELNRAGVGSGGRVRSLEDCSIDEFAAAVHAAIGEIGTATTKRFGARKVFISAIWAQLTGGTGPMSDEFAIRLLTANRVGLLSLARADLVAAMPAGAVAASEIGDNRSEYHFVIDQGARDPWEVAS